MKIGEYTIIKQIGEGSFGIVQLAQDGRGNPYAIKVVSMSNVTSASQIARLSSEIQVAKNIVHQNLVRLFDVIYLQVDACLVFEYCNLGSLEEYLAAGNSVTEEEAISILSDICRGYEMLHKNSIIHRDLALKNIFLHKGADNRIAAKIGDYGLSKNVENIDIELQRRNSIVGTPLYMSPELITENEYNYQVDIFAIGIIYYYLLYGMYPFQSTSQLALIRLYEKGVIKFDSTRAPVSKVSVEFIIGCLRYKAADRFKIKQLTEHKLITKSYSEIKSESVQALIMRSIL
jgi:serine/threonine protein kinase